MADTFSWKGALFALAAWFACPAANASVVITGTRVIYPSDAPEVSVKLDNKGGSPVLIQSWIDNGNADAAPETLQVPFILTPPINRVEPGKGQTLRITFTGKLLPADRESVYWLNVLEIPARKASPVSDNYLQVAFRSRIKLFLRPKGLEGNPNLAVEQVTWRANGQTIEAINPTPYFISLVRLKLNGKSVDGDMISPKSTMTVKLPGNAGNKLAGVYVNDYGALNEFEATLK
ncbi:COG3121: P pilus assembly protein, chaperone PapD [Cronobacter condimenti 1330]|uniref:COG3121: P pilus assembly protein, chaperone PapD n=1 Tax=Cronobacter condimenti 1330 TaxID=1073999 RepID=K8A7M5_9ENTR|nr:fimbria/pilus periplasmic chaperone [Cronobacter condimenti]ALB61199.1 pilus assembly protein PapD [Cronobacter condimenti 1330]CCJ71679.1 COG3121: P pilus assembly protein, chaperone PapD [Cronobacter condimenti 1330]